MQFKRIFTLLVLLMAVSTLVYSQPVDTQECSPCDADIAQYALDGCTVVIVGKKASTDGSIITTHTCDCGVCDWSWRYVPPADHEPDAACR